ncbi:hypothetical protein [Streptomyces sp. NPDC126499]|uniref:hypothetical protein n=1 Tax=Streptomyces sp. NPDC126499 TaxID=3155314 RepID=UPI003326BC2D
MARLLVQNDDVVVRLSWREALLARRKGVRVPLAEVQEARVESDWWRAMRGAAERGKWRAERFCMGTWRHAGGVDFVAVRAPGPVAVVDLFPGGRFARLSVSTPDPEGAVQAVRLAAQRAREEGRPAAREVTGPSRSARRPLEKKDDTEGEERSTRSV